MERAKTIYCYINFVNFINLINLATITAKYTIILILIIVLAFQFHLDSLEFLYINFILFAFLLHLIISFEDLFRNLEFLCPSIYNFVGKFFYAGCFPNF